MILVDRVTLRMYSFSNIISINNLARVSVDVCVRVTPRV